MLQIDWVALGVVLALVTAIGGAAVSYGFHRRRVEELAQRQDEADARMDKIEAALKEATAVGQQVELLRRGTEASHQMLLLKQDAGEKLMTEKFEGVAREVRAFMQGQASGDRRRTSPA